MIITLIKLLRKYFKRHLYFLSILKNLMYVLIFRSKLLKNILKILILNVEKPILYYQRSI